MSTRTSSSRFRLIDLYPYGGIATRNSARDICEQLRLAPMPTIILDFKGIEYASISFLDQLFWEIDRIKEKRVILENVTGDLANLKGVVERRAFARQTVGL